MSEVKGFPLRPAQTHGLGHQLMQECQEDRVCHPERVQDVLAKINVQPFAPDDLDDAAYPIEVGDVLPARAGSNIHAVGPT